MRSDAFDLCRSVAIVTGSGRGIGRSIARGLARHGARLIVVDVDGDSAEAAATELTTMGFDALSVKADVRTPTDLDAVVESAVREYGQIDILVNNVGGTIGPDVSIQSMTLEDWQRTMELTVTTTFLCTRAVVPIMIDRGHGKIINIASIFGCVGHDPAPYDRRPDGEERQFIGYIAGKGAVVSLTRGLAVYLARHNININAIAPGHVRTEASLAYVSEDMWRRLSKRTPLARPAESDDIAGAAIFLASSASDFVTGHVLIVDGGWMAQ